MGLMSLMSTKFSGAAKFLLNWPTTDVNITTQSGASFLARVRNTAECFAKTVERLNNPGRVQRESEEMLLIACSLLANVSRSYST
jgi:hypothetical protein